MPACVQPGPPPAPSNNAGTAISGIVLGSDGKAIPDAPVWLSVIDGASSVVQQVRTDANGAFALNALATGPHRVEATAPGHGAGVTEFDIPRRGAAFHVDVHLAALSTETLRGMLLTTDDLPLTADELAFMFPLAVGHDERAATVGSDGVPEFFPFAGDSDLSAHVDLPGQAPSAAPIPVSIDPNDATLSFEAPTGSRGELRLRFRGDTLATARWSPERRTIEVRVDLDAARAKLGTLDVGIGLGAGSGRTLLAARLRDDAGWPLAEFDLTAAPPRVRLVGIPIGEYGVFVRGDHGTAMTAAVVTSGRATRVTLSPAELSSARVMLEAASGADLERALAGIVVRTPRGQRLDATRTLSSRTGDTKATVVFSGLPAGDLVVNTSGLAMLVRAEPEAAPTPLVVPSPVRFEVDVPLDRGVSDGVLLAGRLVVVNESGLVCADMPFALPARGDALRIPLEGPPGRYRVRIDMSPWYERSLEVEFAGDGRVLRP